MGKARIINKNLVTTNQFFGGYTMNSLFRSALLICCMNFTHVAANDHNLNVQRQNSVQSGVNHKYLQDQIAFDYVEDPNLSRIHLDAYYHLAAISDNGDVVQLNDASKWSVRSNDRNKVMYWVGNDDIWIKPNAKCFSFYKYVLYDRNTGETADVNLISPPLPMTEVTYRVVNIDYNSRLVQLSDNTVWQIDAYDRQFPYWEVGHRIVIGVNNEWRTAIYPQILINSDLYREPYSKAEFFGYPIGY